MAGTIAIIMVFSIPILGIITTHIEKQTKLKNVLIQEQIKLEKMKHENFLLETEKMKMELEKIQLEDRNNRKTLL